MPEVDAASLIRNYTSGWAPPVGSLPQRMSWLHPDTCQQCGAAVASWPHHDAWHEALALLVRVEAASADE